MEGLKAPLIQVMFGIAPVSYGWLGIFSAVAIVFFAYIGFDIVATAAEEARRPQRDLPVGLIGSSSSPRSCTRPWRPSWRARRSTRS